MDIFKAIIYKEVPNIEKVESKQRPRIEIFKFITFKDFIKIFLCVVGLLCFAYILFYALGLYYNIPFKFIWYGIGAKP